MENPKLLGLKVLEQAKLVGLALVTGVAAAVDEESRIEMTDGMQVLAEELGYVPRLARVRLLLLDRSARQQAYQQIAWGLDSYRRRTQHGKNNWN